MLAIARAQGRSHVTLLIAASANETAAAPSCTPRAKAATVDAGGEVVVRHPAPGRWVAVVDAYAVPDRTTSYSYVDVYTHPRFGTISVTDVDEQREVSGTWTGKAHVWAAALPEARRMLWARLLATSRAVESADGSPIELGSMDIPVIGTEAALGLR